MNFLFDRRVYFNKHLPKLTGSNRRNDVTSLSNTCPSCGYPTLKERCAWEICSICFWEDDGQDDIDADKIYGGPNDKYSLTQHRIEWGNNLNDIRNGDSEIGKLLKRIDGLILFNNHSDINEILGLVKNISIWLESEREKL